MWRQEWYVSGFNDPDALWIIGVILLIALIAGLADYFTRRKG